MSPEGRRLGAIMFTDVVGYSSMSSRDEATALGLLGRYRSILKAVFPKYEGRVVKTMGDGFMVEFASAVEAVNCAVEAQKDMGNFNSSLTEDQKVLVRIGIHVGDVVHAGEDVLGDAVNVASRVEPLAQPGGICVTRQVVDQVEGKVKWSLTSLGMKAVKNIPNPIEVYAVGGEKFGAMKASRPSPDKRRVAILPFSNLSPDPNDRYFADGMTEELISTVSKIGGLSVISRASAMRYRDSSLPTGQVGHELRVGAILEGSVRKAGNKVRIATQLIEVDTDKYVWSQSYDRDLTDIFAVQGEIAQRVAEGLRVQLLSTEKEKLETKQTESPEAYSLYLKGRYYWNERTEPGTKMAIKYFEEALKADPRYARAYTGLADSYLILSDYGWMPSAKAGELARENILKALELDESLAEAHASLGLNRANHGWDFVAAEDELKRAIELNPNYVSAYHWSSSLLNFMGRHEEALRMLGQALELDPFSLVLKQARGVTLMTLHRYEQALDELKAVAEEKPDLPSVHYWMCLVYLVQSRYDEAIQEGVRQVKADNYDPGSKLDLAFANSEAGRKEEATDILDEVLANKDEYYSPASVGFVMLSLGRGQEAVAWLERAFSERDSALLYVRVVPAYAKYAKFPGWVDIERRMGLSSVSSRP